MSIELSRHVGEDLRQAVQRSFEFLPRTIVCPQVTSLHLDQFSHLHIFPKHSSTVTLLEIDDLYREGTNRHFRITDTPADALKEESSDGCAAR